MWYARVQLKDIIGKKIDINLYKINKLVCTNGTDVSSNENVAGK